MIALTRATPHLLDPARYPFRHRITTRYADLDPNHHVNNVALAAAFEDARARFDHQAGTRVHARHLSVMVAANYMDYVGEAHYPEPIDLLVGMWELGRSSWTLGSLAVQGEKPCAFSRVVLVAMRNGRPSVLPDILRAGLEAMRIDLSA